MQIRRTQPKLHRTLVASGWFSEGQGPYGLVPVQLTGYLTTGEYAYFRARGKRASLEISASPEATPHRTFSQEVHVDHELGAGMLPTAQAVQLIKGWLAEHMNAVPPAQT